LICQDWEPGESGRSLDQGATLYLYIFSSIYNNK
jgi:hypothetical protein